MIRLCSQCIECLLTKHINKYPTDAPEEKKFAYLQAALRILSDAGERQSAPEVLADIEALKMDMFGAGEDFTKEKAYFNALMLRKEQMLKENIRACENPFDLAIRYAMIGNFIDFGALENVDESALENMLCDAEKLVLDEKEVGQMKAELSRARRLVYITDNCGEIVTDKLLLATILQLYPNLEADVLVRGGAVLNDATMEDALQVGMDTVAPLCHNGTSVAGTVLEKISAQAREKIERADVILSKGQGNFETLRYCEKNVYYLFMCKCIIFAERFGVERFSPMVLNDLRMK